MQWLSNGDKYKMNDYEWRMILLARYVIEKPLIGDRRTFLSNYEKKNSKAAREKLNEYIMREWLTRKEWMK